MLEITRPATFGPSDPLPRIRRDLACPACGHVDSDRSYELVGENELRMFCVACGAFVTTVLSAEQASVIRQLAARRGDGSERPNLAANV